MQVELVGELPYFLRRHFDAGHAADDDCEIDDDFVGNSILPASARIAPGGLQVAARNRADPDLGIGRGNGEPADALEMFRLLRNANLRMLAHLSNDEWDRFGVHAERGRISIRDLAQHMAGRDLTCLRLIDVGGGPVPEKLKEDLRSTLGVETVESYGLTEISPVSSPVGTTPPSATASRHP